MFRRLVILAVLLTGCTAQEAVPPPSSPPPASSSVPVPDKWNQLAARAESAYVVKEAFAPDAPWNKDHPGTPRGAGDNAAELPSACAASNPAPGSR